MKVERNTAQMKEKFRNTQVQINEKDIGKLSEKKLRIMIVKMIQQLESRMEKMQESIKKDLEVLKNKHTVTNNTITEIKNTLEGIHRRISEAEQISELEEKMVEIIAEEQNKVKRMKITEDSPRALCDNIKCINIQILGVLDKEEKKKRYQKIFEEIVVENFPNMGKEIVNHVQEVQSPIQDKPKEKQAKAHTNQTNKD